MTLPNLLGSIIKIAMANHPDERLQWPAPERNKSFILEVLRDVLLETILDGSLVLEIGSGSGAHICHFASQLQNFRWQPSDPEDRHQKSIKAWIKHVKTKNILPPIYLDTREEPWPIKKADAILCINMIHISPWESCQNLFSGASRILPRDGVIYLYGPFSVDGIHTADSNAIFDRSLKSRNSEWGIRDLNGVRQVAENNSFRMTKKISMPANNLSLVFNSVR